MAQFNRSAILRLRNPRLNLYWGKYFRERQGNPAGALRQPTGREGPWGGPGRPGRSRWVQEWGEASRRAWPVGRSIARVGDWRWIWANCSKECCEKEKQRPEKWCGRQENWAPALLLLLLSEAALSRSLDFPEIQCNPLSVSIILIKWDPLPISGNRKYRH